ncbi:MAG: MoaF N-terminal domain-containing protein [Bacteroidota bacterium]
MKRIITLTYAFMAITLPSMSQGEQLLDGTSLNYQYQNGRAVHAEFADGQYKYTWTAGPYKGAEGQEKYQSKKIGDKLYMINFKVSSSSTFVTIVFNFDQSVMYSSAIFNPGTEQEQIFMEGGIIDHLKLKEK